MKTKSTKVSIPNPCAENWNEMTPNERGRHCAVCAKTVIDFTKMSKHQIFDTVNSAKGQICGRIEARNLDVELNPYPSSRPWIKYAAMLLGLSPITLYSQAKSEPVKIAAQDVKQEIKIGKVKPSTQEADSMMISGRILDENGESLLFANIAVIKDHKVVRGTMSDIDGNYNIKIGKGESIEVSYLGYSPKRVDFEKGWPVNGKLDINLPSYNFFIGDIVIEENKFNSWLKKITKTLSKKAYFLVRSSQSSTSDSPLDQEKEMVIMDQSNPKKEVKGFEIKILPNPSQGQFEVNINQNLNNGELIITNTANEVIRKHKIDQPILEVDLSTFPSGPYILSIIENGKLVKSEVLVKI